MGCGKRLNPLCGGRVLARPRDDSDYTSLVSKNLVRGSDESFDAFVRTKLAEEEERGLLRGEVQAALGFFPRHGDRTGGEVRERNNEDAPLLAEALLDEDVA
jgi:hypothetical protein